MNKENKQSDSNHSELKSLKEALAKKDQELKNIQAHNQKIEQEREEVRQVLKDEEEKSLLRKYGFASEELENIRLLGKGTVTEELLKDLKQKAYQKQTNAFISLLKDQKLTNSESKLPWEDLIQHMNNNPKGKIR